ncbi:hypothetical protein TNIN_209091 [Trichonephila inaurata madagascariensis]|uniref:Uncharacterized protein n=1 Tax=Trichonephila inaurata madagascariensis TaxID=2747483 RepID=A0A8X6MLQ6_9ARAC|nr:hypothetical protein TNIN_209091 [Trichonephila inaurata madagascariensis]
MKKCVEVKVIFLPRKDRWTSHESSKIELIPIFKKFEISFLLNSRKEALQYQQKLMGQEKSQFKPTRRIPSTLVKDVRQEKSPSKPEQSPVATVAMNEEAVRESHGDALDINERSPFLPDPREQRVSKRREWSSASFSGSVKDIKRVVTWKIPRPSSNLVITTAEIHNEEGPLRIKPSVTKKKIHVSKNQSCIYYGPEMIEAS